jgi:hypothetical protein
MEITRTDVVPQLRAAGIEAREHAAAAIDAAKQIPGSDGVQRELAAARAVDEFDHAIDAAKVVPGLGRVPAISSAITAYETGRAVLRGATGTAAAGAAHPVLGASELLAARDHLADGVALYGQPGATEVERQRATARFDAALEDANSGFAFVGHPAQEGPIRATIGMAKQAVDYRQPIDQASIAAAIQALEQAAGASLAGSTIEQPLAMPGTPPAAEPQPPVTEPQLPVTQPRPLGLPPLDLPPLVLPPVPSFATPR